MPSFPEIFFERLVRSAPDSLIILRAGRIVLVNDRAEEMFGYRQHELHDGGLERLISPWCRAFCEGLVADSAKQLVGNDHDIVGLRKDGSEFPAEAKLWRIQTEERELIAVVLRDISQRRHAEEGLKARVQQQALVAELGRRALMGIDLQQLMTEAVNLICSTLPVDHGNVLELLPDGRVLFQAGVGWKEGLVGLAATEAQSAVPAAHVLRTQTPVIVEDFATDDRFPNASLLREHGIVSSLNVPLYGHERPFGVLGAHTMRRKRFTDEDVHFVQSVANVLSAAIERKWLEQRQ